MNKVPMTEAGFKNLQDELKKLVNKKRPAIIAAITEARGHGDLSENAEYQYAKEHQNLIELKISELENTIVQAEIIDISKLSGKEIMFGATVKIKDNETNEQSIYQIVGEYESDIENKKISISSPMARGLIGRSEKDVVEINSPKGIKFYTVISVIFQ